MIQNAQKTIIQKQKKKKISNRVYVHFIRQCELKTKLFKINEIKLISLIDL